MQHSNRHISLKRFFIVQFFSVCVHNEYSEFWLHLLFWSAFKLCPGDNMLFTLNVRSRRKWVRLLHACLLCSGRARGPFSLGLSRLLLCEFSTCFSLSSRVPRNALIQTAWDVFVPLPISMAIYLSLITTEALFQPENNIGIVTIIIWCPFAQINSKWLQTFNSYSESTLGCCSVTLSAFTDLTHHHCHNSHVNVCNNYVVLLCLGLLCVLEVRCSCLTFFVEKLLVKHWMRSWVLPEHRKAGSQAEEPMEKMIDLYPKWMRIWDITCPNPFSCIKSLADACCLLQVSVCCCVFFCKLQMFPLP